MKVSQDSLAKYQNNKKWLQKKPYERYQSLSKEEKEKNATKWSLTIQKSTRKRKTKACSWQNIIKWEKSCI